VTILHTGLPTGTGHRYEEGWRNFYFDRMKKYFAAAPAVPSSREEGARDRAAVEASKRGARAVGTRVLEVGDGSGVTNGDEIAPPPRAGRRLVRRKPAARAKTGGKKKAAGKKAAKKAPAKSPGTRARAKKTAHRKSAPAARRGGARKKRA
jgi:hypothetical protein